MPDFTDATTVPGTDDGPIGFLDALRRENFTRILNVLERHAGRGKLLDVGCGPGLFLGVAEERGYEAIGIEPKPEMAAAALGAGHAVRQGLFPDAVSSDERFAVIIFNDVLEHIPDIHGALAACRSHLENGGTLVINVPNSRGTLYAVARAMRMIGISGPFERLWQAMFYSPHVHYFSRKSLTDIAARYGFEPVRIMPLASVSYDGLWARISADPTTGFLRRIAAFIVVGLAIPLLRVLPSDAMVGFFQTRVERDSRH